MKFKVTYAYQELPDICLHGSRKYVCEGNHIESTEEPMGNMCLGNMGKTCSCTVKMKPVYFTDHAGSSVSKNIYRKCN